MTDVLKSDAQAEYQQKLAEVEKICSNCEWCMPDYSRASKDYFVCLAQGYNEAPEEVGYKVLPDEGSDCDIW